MSAAAQASSTTDITYQDLYRRWEEGNWSAMGLDFSRDREGWDALDEMQQRSGLWIYSMFFYGEDSVADNLSPYIDAAPLEEQKYFLTTRMADELRRDRSLPKFAQAITLYHMVVEATLAQPGQHFIEDYFVKEGTMPGFSEGMANVSRDEQRHIGFGVKALSEMFAESDECKQAVAELLREVMPYSLGVFTPPNWDLEYT